MDAMKALTEGVTQDIIAYLVEEEQFPIEQAMEAVYHAEVFEKLLDKETGLYRESSAYVATLLTDELTSGSFVQKEI